MNRLFLRSVMLLLVAGAEGWTQSWHRWIYSLNVKRGNQFWAIIETLPNDFMDSDKDRVKE